MGRLRISIAREGTDAYPSPRVESPAAAAELFMKTSPDDGREHFRVLLLSARHIPIAVCTISIGCLSASLVHPRELFRIAILAGASGLVVTHNHPSGEIEPSPEDLALTRRLVAAGSLMGIEVLDHIITRNGTQRVQIRFGSPHLPDEASLEILDDGHGMSQEVLLGPWLEPATDFKVSGGPAQHGGERSPRGRRRLGSKGVGRFAAQRLGRALTLRTSTGRQPTMLEADFNWDRLDRGDRYLDQLTVPWREVRSRSGRWHGTSLLIGSLRDRWVSSRFDRLRLALSRLLGPGLGANPFAIELAIDASIEQIRPAIDQLPPMYAIRGNVKAGGRARITYTDIFGVEEHWDRSVLWPSARQTCGSFDFRLNAWDLDREALAFFLEKNALGLGSRDFRRTIRDHSGLSLYRDGFRMLPYGEPDNDWLRLDRRRVNNPTLRLSNNQILGRLRISADGNPNLQDQTNREGLVSNDAYTHLQHVLLELLAYFEARRFASRRSAPCSSGPRTTSLPVAVSNQRDDHDADPPSAHRP